MNFKLGFSNRYFLWKYCFSCFSNKKWHNYWCPSWCGFTDLCVLIFFLSCFDL